jgi:beta-phosphoglucomutase-like phosphatase (HAD superfamily)
MPITKVITDNDGVNIDSEDVAMRVMDDWGVDFITRFNPEEAAQLQQDYIYTTYPGTSTDKIVRALIEKHDLSPELIRVEHDIADDVDIGTHLADLITLETNKRFEAELKSIPGVTEAWQELSDMLGPENIALATTSRADRMDVSLAHAVDPVTGANAGLTEFFPEGPRRFSGYGGPNKYDAAFEVLGWDPADVAIVEDSLSGVRYAKAGRPEVSVIGTVAAKFYTDKDAHAANLLDAGANVVISTMSDLPKAVDWLSGGMDPKQRPDFEGKIYARPTQPGEPMAAPSWNL